MPLVAASRKEQMMVETEGQEPTVDEGVEEVDVEGQEPDVDSEQPAEEVGFEGDFDPQRARRTIDRLRAENKQLKAKPKEADASGVQRENLQLRAALKLGVPETFAARLQGETVEEMIEDASALLDALGVKGEGDAGPRAPRREPRRKLAGGSQPTEEPELTPAQIVAKALGR